METGALQSLFNQKAAHAARPAALQPGQIINGKIIKLFPDQIAQVQIGNQKMIAQLEAPLSANERYWFQVQPGEGKIHLKVIGPGTDDVKQTDGLSKILGEFSMAQTKENIELIRFFVKEQLPVHREILLEASAWLKTVDSRSTGLEALKIALSRGLPISQATLSALYTSSKEPSLLGLMETLLKEMEGQFENDTSARLTRLLDQFLPSNKSSVSLAVPTELIATWIKGNRTESETAYGLLKQYSALPVKSSENVALQQMLANLRSVAVTKDELPAELSLAKDILASLERGNSSAAKQLLLPFMGEEAVEEIVPSLKMLTSADTSGEKSADNERMQAFKTLLSALFSGKSNPAALEESLPILLGGKGDIQRAGLEMLRAAGQLHADLDKNQQTELLLKIINKAEESVILPETGSAILSSGRMKSFLEAIGLSYEHQIAEVFKGQADEKLQDADTLKAHLLRLLNENPPQAVKDTAEKLLNKVTGFQLLSQESGPLQQLVMQIPFVMDGKMNELTMQWSGKKTEDGKIDADFCRVLFYLKLKNLDDTIVDMQVQNRILSIQVINENPLLKKLSEQLTPVLKIKLAEIDYHLSAVQFNVPGQAQPGGKQRRIADLYRRQEYSGVDLKI